MNNLQKFKDMATSLKQSLSALSSNPGTLEDLDSVTKQRITIKEKLAVVADMEAAERDRLVKEQAKEKEVQRKEFLLDIAGKAEAAKKQHVKFTKDVTALINDLVSVLIERETVFTQETTGLRNNARYDLLTNDEYQHLVKQFESSFNGIYSGDFGKTYETALNEQCADDENLRRRLRELVSPSREFHSSLKGVNSNLVKAAKTMANNPAPEPIIETVEIVPPNKQGNHYVADLRDNSPVIEI